MSTGTTSTGATATRKHRTVPTWAIVSVGGVGTVAAVLWASGLHDSTGNELLDGPAASVILGVLGFLGTVLTLLLQRTGAVKHQVQNSHQENLRDDLDGKHQEQTEKLDAVLTELQAQGRRLSRVEDGQTMLAQAVVDNQRRLNRHSNRIEDIEDTVDTRRRKEGKSS